jgi:hypothetical protein
MKLAVVVRPCHRVSSETILRSSGDTLGRNPCHNNGG